MPSTNPFFTATTGYTGEQSLVDDLVIEQIAMYGIDLLYMPREQVNLDRLLHESTADVFRLSMSIPMYIKSFDGYDNSIEILSKFGVRSSDELTVIMSRTQWNVFYAPYIKSYYNAIDGRPPEAPNDFLAGQTARRPKEGDLIFFPYDNSIFEVKYVQFDQPFYQLGKGYIFELQLEKFEYSGETMDTGVSQIDTVPARSTFPDVQFEMIEGGVSTFKQNEVVRIYNLTEVDIADLATEDGGYIFTDDFQFINPDGIDYFQMFNDAGFIRRVLTVEGRVAFWNAGDRKLNLTNLSDMNPDLLNPDTGNVDVNTFDTVLIMGLSSGAMWTSHRTMATPKPFDDARDIQEEFEEIAIYDPGDTAPFGFY